MFEIRNRCSWQLTRCYILAVVRERWELWHRKTLIFRETLRILRHILTESLANSRIQTLVNDLKVKVIWDLSFAWVRKWMCIVEDVGAGMHVLIYGCQGLIDIWKSILIHVFVLCLEGCIFRIQYGLFAMQEGGLLAKDILTKDLHFPCLCRHT